MVLDINVKRVVDVEVVYGLPFENTGKDLNLKNKVALKDKMLIVVINLNQNLLFYLDKIEVNFVILKVILY